MTGVKYVMVVNSREELLAAINPRTVGVYFSHAAGDRGALVMAAPELIQISQGSQHLFLLATTPRPTFRLQEPDLGACLALGFDMVSFSGGKNISGPQSSGILIGRENLISWALLNMSPQEDRIGRPCKVGKEQIFAALKALEMFVNRDEDADNKMYDARAQVITDALAKFGVTCNRTFNTRSQGGQTPHYTWQWDSAKVNLTGDQVRDQLFATRPVAIGYIYPSDYDPLDRSRGRRGRPDPNWPGGSPDPNLAMASPVRSRLKQA